MSSIDRADWHYGGNFPENLPTENGGTHIGFYLNWIIDNNLIGELHRQDSKDGLEKVLNKTINGRDFLFEYCDEKIWDECFNEIGLEFTYYYYKESDSNYNFLDDYLELLGMEYDSLYEVPYTEENYKKMANRIDEVYSLWLKTKQPKSKSWMFWKK
jgi:hypothetical protein